MLRTTHFIVAACIAVMIGCSPPQPQQQQPPAEAPVTTAETASSAPVLVVSPAPGARVTSPLVVEGSAPGDWYFEAQFPVKLVGADGAVLAEAPAMSQSDWMTEAPVAYRARLTFSVAQETPATLVLQEDMPADNANPREVTVPVVLVPR
jgi:Immunoglobulin-like domain of bacterial spore germination